MSPAAPPPAADPQWSVLESVQRAALRGMVRIVAVGTPLLSAIGVVRILRTGDDSPLMLLLTGTIAVGPALLLVERLRLTIRQSGVLIVVWIATIAVTATWINGPVLGNGIAWVCALFLGQLLVGRRVGLVLLVAYVLVSALQLAAVSQGWAPPPREFRLRDGAISLLLTQTGGLVALAIAFAGFALVIRSLRESLERLEQERRLREAALEARHRTEGLMRANQHFEALGKLASGVAHDVNNALTGVMGHAELLGQLLPEGPGRAATQDILGAARAAAQTTRQLLGLSRNRVCSPASVQPALVAEAVVRLARRTVREGISLRLEAATQRRILVDPADLQQALLNLVLNARDAMPDGGEILTLVEERAGGTAGRPWVAVRVADRGRGIPPDVLPRIFEPFFTTKPVGQGTGLGLPMVKAFVDEAGGRIDVTSRPGFGTTVTLEFPEALADPVAPVPTPVPSVADLPGRRVLLLEEGADLLALFTNVLSRGGLTVLGADSVDAALARLDQDRRFDLLCTECLSGVQPLIARFRQGNPRAPVLVCTGRPADELCRAGLDRDDFALLRKPFTGTELLARTQQLLRAGPIRQD